MKRTTQQFVQACWRSPIFGDSYDSSVTIEEIEGLAAKRERASIAAFTPIIARGMPELPPETRDQYVRSMSRMIVGIFMSLAVEFRDVDRLTRASLPLAVSAWGNNYLDCGDAAMETAIRMLLAEHNVHSELETLIGREDPGPKQFSDTNSAAVETRLGALREIQSQISALCRAEDAAVLLGERSFQFLKHSMGLSQLTRMYLQDRCSDFWKMYAFQYAKHLVLSNSVFSHIGHIYAMMRREQPDLPSLADILEVQPLMRLVEGLINSAMRIFDDVGDREIDDGAPVSWIPDPGSLGNWGPQAADDLRGRNGEAGAPQLKQVSLFNTPDLTLIRAFFHFIGIIDEALIEQAINGFQSRYREGDKTIISLWVDLLRKQVNDLPSEILQRYSLYVTLIKRVIECGYVNSVGDRAYGE
jgi:hypothetical protein